MVWFILLTNYVYKKILMFHVKHNNPQNFVYNYKFDLFFALFILFYYYILINIPLFFDVSRETNKKMFTEIVYTII